METITITKRIINGKEVYNKRFDDYDKGFYGQQISKKEYEESKNNNIPFVIEDENTPGNKSLNIKERVRYEN